MPYNDHSADQAWELPHGVGNTSSWLRQYVAARYPGPVPESAHRAWEHLHKGQYHCNSVQDPCIILCQEPGMQELGLAMCTTTNPPWVCTGESHL